ncbi:L,D-transpeptidase family protein [Fluviispira multicolorata]|uniref:L,D-transpeptidase family protein n=1 Tax=Fluviispira multicolorata TaxID=2654512 RepID=A0A833JAW9_9BACT|nr:L,D-transpeptidase family protein [Fluviispira multicolorata]KAB8027743.1 L,D-transpeptidase family protein [Fluviispira multicolorata]
MSEWVLSFIKSLALLTIQIVSISYSIEVFSVENTIIENQAIEVPSPNIFMNEEIISPHTTQLPTALISLGNEPISYALIVEKLQHKLSVYKSSSKGDYELIKAYRAITGKKQGDKKFTGDKRTPEGIYFITGKINGNKLPPKYGPGAFILDYPNIYDQRLSKTGYGIWIHGVEDDSRADKPFDTDGCIALKNKDWLELEQYIFPFDTPVIITKEMKVAISHQDIHEQKEKIMKLIEDWRLSWKDSELEKYNSFYSNSFNSSGKDKRQWLDMKKNISSIRNRKISIEISEPKILAFENQVLVSFFQKYQSQGKEDFGRKFLYFQLEDSNYKIVSEKWFNEPEKNDHINALVRQNNNELNTKQ